MATLGGVATLCAGLFVSTVNFVMNFNWNATDKELLNQLLGKTNTLAGQLGGALGNFFGWLTVGVISGAIIYKINPLLAVKVLTDLGEERLEELCSNVTTLVRSVADFLIQSQVIAAYGAIRFIAKRVLSDPNSPLRKLIGEGAAKSIQKWGEEGTKPWTFAQARDELIESLPAPLESLVEEFVEEFWDASVEALYIVATDIDQYIAEKQVEKSKFGQEEVVELIPNRDFPEEKLILAGPQELLKPVLMGTMTTHQIIEKKDVGIMMGGEPIANTITTHGLPYMRITFSNNENKKVKPTYIDIHNIDHAKVDNWAELKAACGGANGYMWGPYFVEVTLPDNDKIKCFAQSEQEGVDLIEGLLKFSKGGDKPDENYWMRGGTLRKGTTKKYDSTYKTPRRQYPYEIMIVNQQRILNEENGRANRSGIYEKREAILPLWTKDKPSDWKEKINELFRTPGSNA